MTQHIFAKSGFLLVCISIVLAFFACHKDLTKPTFVVNLDTKELSKQEEIEAAQNWYEDQKFAEAAAIGLQPQWKNATVYGNRLEIPVLFNGKRIKKSIVKEDEHHLSKTRLVLYKKQENTYETYLLYFTPSKNFNISMDAVNIGNYSAMKFDGKIFVATLGNKAIGMYTIINGERSKLAEIVEKAHRDVPLKGLECIYYADYICTEEWLTELDPVTGQSVSVKKWICEPAGSEICYYISEDPCSGANPPAYCNPDPCSDRVPPPYCDPCNRPNSPSDCNLGGVDGAED